MIQTISPEVEPSTEALREKNDESTVPPLLSQSAKTPPHGSSLFERVQARVRPDEQYREEIVRSIFGEVGTPVEGDVLSIVCCVACGPYLCRWA